MKSVYILHTYDHMAILKQELLQKTNLQRLWPALISEGNQWILSSLAQQTLKLFNQQS